jgi:hypothetical protein
MACLFQYPELWEYVTRKEQENVGSFLATFLELCLRADAENFEIIKPALEKLQEKYPLRKEFHEKVG